MPVRAVTTRFMYKGLCTIPDVLTYRTPVNLPEDEVEGEACCFLLSVCLLALSMVQPVTVTITAVTPEFEVQLPNQDPGELQRVCAVQPFQQIRHQISVCKI